MRAFLVIVGVSLLCAAGALALTGDEPRAAEATTVNTSGGFELSNSHDGMPILGAAGIAPGDSVQGGVEIANSGEQAGELILEQVGLEGSGGDLAGTVTLSVDDVTELSAPASLYAGPLAAMTTTRVGILQPGESRSFSFNATLPETAAPQNPLQGASLSVGYRWRMVEPTALRVSIKRLRIKARAGKLVLRARCDRPCRLVVRGRASVRFGDRRRTAGIRPARRLAYTAAPRRLTLRLPRRLRQFLGAHPGAKARVRVVVVGRTPEGITARASSSRRR